MRLTRAKRYLAKVLHHQEAIPFKRFRGGPGRHAQAKQFQTSQCRWPTKSVLAVLKLLKNAEANANTKKLDTKKLIVTHTQVNRAQKIRRRTFRAHGRINPYMSSPSHLEIVLTEAAAITSKPPPQHVKKPERESGKHMQRQNRRPTLPAALAH
jgi:large subunit ribosomal protein L17e